MARTTPSLGAGRIEPSRVTRAGMGWFSAPFHLPGFFGVGVGLGGRG